MKFSLRFPATPSSDATRNQRRRSLLLAVILIALLPLAWRGPSCGQDFDFHLDNWLEVVAHWKAGILYPHWAASPNYLAGEPRFVFYPPLSWLLGGLLGLVLPWNWTGLAFTLLALAGAGFSFRAMARHWMPEDSATIAACLYVVNPYMLFVAYERGAMAELLAATWFPLIVLFALRNDSGPEHSGPARPSFLPLSFTVAALWLTNAPAAVMGCYMLAVIVAVAALTTRSWRPIARALPAVALGLALAGFWLIPAIYEQRWVQIQLALGPLMHVEDSFLFGYVPLPNGTPDDQFDTLYHNHILQLASWITVALILATALAAWKSGAPRPWFWGRGNRKRESERFDVLFLPLLVIAAVVTVLQFRFSDPLWRHIPELQYLQFPWRWMLVLGFIFAALAGLAIGREQTTRRAIAARALAVLILAATMALLSSVFFWQPCDEEDNIAAQRTAFTNTGFQGTDEYTPQAAGNSQIQQSLPKVRLLRAPDAEAAHAAGDNPPLWRPDNAQEIPAAIRIARWTPERIDATIATTTPGYAVLHLMDYPAWRVILNNSESQTHLHRSDGLLVIPIAAGSSTISIRWRLTPDQSAGMALTLAALAFTLIYAWSERRSRVGNRIQ